MQSRLSVSRVVVLLSCVGACSGAARAPTAPSRKSAPSANDSTRCERACAASEHDERERTICHACRCKEALGELPPPEAITCAAGATIPIYRLENGKAVETKEQATTCKNPALLDLMPALQACTPGSRLGQVVTPTAI